MPGLVAQRCLASRSFRTVSTEKSRTIEFNPMHRRKVTICAARGVPFERS